MSTDKSAAAIKEFAEKQFPLSKELKKEVLYNQIQQAKQNECFSDLTALISEHYVAKEEVDKMVSERLREELIKFVKWYNRDFEEARKPHLIVKEYLKSREDDKRRINSLR